MYINCLIYLRVINEHQVKDKGTSQEIQVSSCLREPKTHFRHAQGHQLAGKKLGSINTIHNTIVAVNGVEHQKTVKINLENGLIGLLKDSKRNLITTFDRDRPEDAKKESQVPSQC